MSKKTAIVLVMAIVGMLASLSAVQGIAVAQKDGVRKQQDELELGEDKAEQLLLLIDTNKTGRVTKQEWMKFMEAEFDRLDKNKSGELDAKELAQSRLRVSPFAKTGK
jgi:hypothetical protein